jgi:hypothetical protein
MTAGELPIQQSEALMRAVVFGLSLLVATSGVSARSNAQIPATGTKVRIDTDTARVVGVITASSSDSIRIALTQRSAGTATVAIGSIRELAVASGKQRHVKQGLAYGALGGAVIGAVTGYATFAPCHDTGFLGCYLEPTSRGQATAVGAGLGAVLGLAVGSIVGALTVTDRWTVVPVLSIH